MKLKYRGVSYSATQEDPNPLYVESAEKKPLKLTYRGVSFLKLMHQFVVNPNIPHETISLRYRGAEYNRVSSQSKKLKVYPFSPQSSPHAA